MRLRLRNTDLHCYSVVQGPNGTLLFCCAGSEWYAVILLCRVRMVRVPVRGTAGAACSTSTARGSTSSTGSSALARPPAVEQVLYTKDESSIPKKLILASYAKNDTVQ
jgi:hypothetical protein